MKKIFLTLTIILGFTISNNIYSQCAIDAQPDSATICEGDFVLLSSSGSCGYLLTTDFNNNQMGVGWTSNASPMYTNPCNPDCDGSTYLWIGPATNFPRELVTTPFDVSAGACQISFCMKYAEQINSTPCEGPDTHTEGVHLQYSINGAAGPWTDINYWDPYPGANTPYLNWAYYTEVVPPAASTSNTSFRWYQDVTSGNDWDHWGLDNVEVVCPANEHTIITWSHGASTFSPPPIYPTTNTMYTVSIEDTSTGNMAYDTVYITVNPVPSATLNITDSVCNNEETVIAYNGTATPLANYTWDWDGGTATPGTGAGPHTVNWANAGSHTITLNVDEGGCQSGLTSFDIEVNASPSISFIPSLTNGCEPLSIDFTNLTSPAIRSYFWYFGDGTSSTQADPSHSFYANGGIETKYDIFLKAITTSGCVDSLILSDFITVHPQPVASFIANPNPARLSAPTVSFTDYSTGGVTAWHWNFGDPSSGNNEAFTQNTMHTYSGEGLYNVTLDVTTSPSPCTDTVNLMVEVIDDDLTFPNVITPNGDGINDVFKIVNVEKYEYNRIDIYNKWGTRVFHAEPYLGDWQPENKAAGTYYYVLYLGAQLDESNLKEYKGTIDVVVD